MDSINNKNKITKIKFLKFFSNPLLNNKNLKRNYDYQDANLQYIRIMNIEI